MEGGKKVSLCCFLADQKIASLWKKCVLGHPIARTTGYCLLPDTCWLRASKNWSRKNYRGKVMEGGKKVSLHRFFGWPEERDFVGKKCVLGHSIAQAAKYCLLPDTFWLRASKNVFEVGSVKFANLLSPPSFVKKVRTRTRSKSSQGLKRCQAKVKGVNNPAWTT